MSSYAQTVKNYSINVANKTITFTDYTTVIPERIALITDVTTGTILYQFNLATVTASVSGNVVTLSAWNGTVTATDKLRIDYTNGNANDPVYETPALPAGAATASAQATIVTNTGRIPALGRATNTTSVPVAISTDQMPDGQTFATSVLQSSGNSILNNINTNVGTLTASTAGGYVRQDSTATIAKETGGNLAAILANQTNGTQQLQGTIAAAATDTGNPVKTGGVYNSTLPTLTTGQRGNTQLDPSGKTLVTGGVAAGATTAVFPVGVKDGSGNIQQAVQAPQAVNTGGGGLQAVGLIGNYNSTLPSTTSGNYGPVQMDVNGRLIVTSASALNSTAPTTAFLMGGANAEQGNLSNMQTLRANFGDGFGATSQMLLNMNTAWNGSALDRLRTVANSVAAGTGVQAMGLVPSTSALAPITYYNAALTNTVVNIAAGAHRFYSYHVYNPNTAGCYVILYDATTATIGTTTPKRAQWIPGGGAWDGAVPHAIGFATGFTVVASTSLATSTAPTAGLITNLEYI